MLHLERSLTEWFRKPGKSGPGGAPDAESGAEKGGSVSRSQTARRGWKLWLEHLRDLLFHTPDKLVGWVPYAVSSGLRLIRENHVEVIYSTGPPHSAHLAGLFLKRLTGLPWVADFRDPWSRQPWRDQSRNPWGYSAGGLLEAECVRRASAVILNTDRLADSFRQHYVNEPFSKFQVVSNGFDPELRTTVQGLLDRAPAAGPERTFRMLHAGSLYNQRSLRPFVDVVRALRAEGLPVSFEQIGHCSNEADTNAYIRECNLQDHITIRPPVPHRQALEASANADILVLIQPGNRLQVPGKLFEMMLFGKPVLALADDGAASDLVHKHRLGVVVGSDDPAQMLAAIRRLVLSLRDGGDPGVVPTGIAAYDGRRLVQRIAALFDRSCGVADAAHRECDRNLHGAGHEYDEPGADAALPSEENAVAVEMCRAL
jgi:glycosyltransferase involved in cell wall biosynthesis